MRVTIFRAFPDAYRQSMTVYADRLLDHLRDEMGPGESAADYLPPRVALHPKLARHWSQYARYQRLARHAQGDVNHVIDQAYAHLVHGLDARRTVVTFHDAIGLSTNGTPGTSRLVRRIIVSGLRKAAAVICDSTAAARRLLETVDCRPDRVDVIPLGVEERFFVEAPGDTAPRARGLAGFSILHVGHTRAYKNIPALLRILATLGREMGEPVRLLKVGEALTPEQERTARELGVADRITHLGLLDRDRLPGAYRMADVLLFPSLDEGFGLPALEAMAAGVPVVASNRGALPEVVGDAGLLVDPVDEPGMAERVAEVLVDPALRARLIAAGRLRARLYSWAVTAAKTLEVYRRVHGGLA
jgi:glycosyltransferase involved in cell wall biosynthesis